MTDDVSESAADLSSPELSLRDRWNRWLLLTRRRHLGLVAFVVAISVAVTLPIGRATAPSPHLEASRAVEIAVLPLALDADGIWTSGSEGRPPVSEALVAFRSDDDAGPILEHAEQWLAAYDASLTRIADLELPPTARPVQRQFISALTLSRDAVEVLHHAALQDRSPLRRALITEAGRLRQRSEQLTQAARASADDLGNGQADVAPLQEITDFLDRD